MDEETAVGVLESTDGSVRDSTSIIVSPVGTVDTPPRWVGFGVEAAVIVAVWSVGAAIFFRSAWWGGFHRLLGDSHDTVLITYLQEHWFQAFHGQVAWQSPAIFAPTKGVLGWSEGFLLLEVFYAPLRLVGFDMFLAAQITIVLFSLVGFASFVCLARVAFGAQRWVALAGGLAFTFANDLWLHVYWSQLLMIWVVPGICLLGVLAFRASAERPARSLMLGGACGLLAAFTFLTSFYVAWFSTLAAGVAGVMLLAADPRHALRNALTRVRAAGWLVPVMALTFAVGMIPFLVVYIPAQGEVTHFTYAQVMHAAPRPQDLLNVGTGNLLWTSVLHHTIRSMSSWSALTYAVTPLLLFFAVVGSTAVLRTSRQAGDRAAVAARWAAVLAATAVVLCILPVRTSVGSLWAVVWHLPGASAIRRNNRIGVVAGFVASLALVCAASEMYRMSGERTHRTLRRTAIAVLVLFAAVEQFNTTPMAELDRAGELAFLRAATAPPAGCRSFYVLDPTRRSLSAGEAHDLAVSEQLDAMLISEKYLLPTLNGYTGYPPRGWGLMYPFAPGYLSSVRSWARTHHVQTGLCQLELAGMRWEVAPTSAGARP